MEEKTKQKGGRNEAGEKVKTTLNVRSVNNNLNPDVRPCGEVKHISGN